MVVFAYSSQKGGSYFLQPNKNKGDIKMKEKQLEYYSKIANWDFSQIKY